MPSQGSDVQHLWAFVSSPFPSALKKAKVLAMSILSLSTEQIVYFGKLTEVPCFTCISPEEYWLHKPMSTLIKNLPFKNDNEVRKPKELDFISYLFYTSVLFGLNHVSKAFKRSFNFLLLIYHDLSPVSRLNNPAILVDILDWLLDRFSSLSHSPTCQSLLLVQHSFIHLNFFII